MARDESVWPASDAICSALQIINHLQDCADDYRKINRVYIPQDRLAAHGVDDGDDRRASATAGLCARPSSNSTERTRALLREGRGLAGTVRGLAGCASKSRSSTRWRRRISTGCMTMDPLAERAKLPRWQMGFVALRAAPAVSCYGAPRAARFGGAVVTLVDSRAGRGGADARRKSSFYLAMRLMPPAQRQAMFEIYSFCRAVDDIADEGGPRAEAPRAGCNAGAPISPRSTPAGRRRGSTRSRRRGRRAFGMKHEDFLAVIDGMEMDVERTVGAGATDWATLDLYCDRVASAVGRLSVRVFGMDEADGIALAHHLGRALQLTNILRDIDEDAEIDRLYLPRRGAARGRRSAATDAARRRRPPQHRAGLPAPSPRGRARISRRRKRSSTARRRAVARTPRIMGEAYRYILDRLMARGWAPPRAPLKLGKLKLAADRRALLPGMSGAKVHVIGAGLAGLSAAVELGRGRAAGRRPRGEPAGRRALPLLFRRHARHGDRQRQPSGAVAATARRWPTPSASAPRDKLVGPGVGDVSVHRSARPASAGRCAPTTGRSRTGC